MKTFPGDMKPLVQGQTQSCSSPHETKTYTRILQPKPSSIAMGNAIPLPAQCEESAFGMQYPQMNFMAFGAACPTENEMLS